MTVYSCQPSGGPHSVGVGVGGKVGVGVTAGGAIGLGVSVSLGATVGVSVGITVGAIGLGVLVGNGAGWQLAATKLTVSRRNSGKHRVAAAGRDMRGIPSCLAIV